MHLVLKEQLNFCEVPLAIYSLLQTRSLTWLKAGFFKITLLDLGFFSNREIPFKEFETGL